MKSLASRFVRFSWIAPQLKKWELSKAHQARSVCCCCCCTMSQPILNPVNGHAWMTASGSDSNFEFFCAAAAVVRDETGLSRSCKLKTDDDDGRMKLCLHVSIQQRRIRVTRYYIQQAGWHTHDERGFFMNSTRRLLQSQNKPIDRHRTTISSPRSAKHNSQLTVIKRAAVEKSSIIISRKLLDWKNRVDSIRASVSTLNGAIKMKINENSSEMSKYLSIAAACLRLSWSNLMLRSCGSWRRATNAAGSDELAASAKMWKNGKTRGEREKSVKKK